jgi:hypothetical protein
MEYDEIDYSAVNRKIVEQAYDSAFHMTEEQTRKLIQDKFERAQAQRQALQKIPYLWHTDR